jgi:RNA polymerase sigma factor for flagellar operon FliA
MKAARSVRTASPTVAKVEPRSVSAQEAAEYMPLVRQVVARFLAKLPPNVLRDDLMAAGTYGLIDSLRKNGDDRGPGFEWYARVRIRGAILDELRTQDWLSRRARSRVAARAGRAEEAGAAPLSAIVAIDDLSEASRSGLCDESVPSPLEAAEQQDRKKTLAAAIDKLLERERFIVQMHYFQGVQFKEIAAHLRVSEPRVSQLHARAMAKLRGTLGEAERSEAAA